jgi:hypothetical protein
MVTPWRTIKGAEPDAIKVASPVLNGEREETGEGPRLALTQLPRCGFRQQVSASVGLRPEKKDNASHNNIGLTLESRWTCQGITNS